MSERDKFLAHSLQIAADSIPVHAMGGRAGGAEAPPAPVVVVGVVGIGHVPGIMLNWGKVSRDDIRSDVWVAGTAPHRTYLHLLYCSLPVPTENPPLFVFYENRWL